MYILYIPIYVHIHVYAQLYIYSYNSHTGLYNTYRFCVSRTFVRIMSTYFTVIFLKSPNMFGYFYLILQNDSTLNHLAQFNSNVSEWFVNYWHLFPNVFAYSFIIQSATWLRRNVMIIGYEFLSLVFFLRQQEHCQCLLWFIHGSSSSSHLLVLGLAVCVHFIYVLNSLFAS